MDRTDGINRIVVNGDTVKLLDGDEEYVRLSADDALAADLPADKRIDFPSPILLFEDKNVRLEAVAFFQEVQKDWDGPAMHKDYITIRFHNRADYEIMYFPNQFYIGNEQVKWVYKEGTPNVLPGKFADYSFQIQKKNDESLSTIEDLYQLEGRFEIFRYENNRLYDRYYSSFSIDKAAE